MMKKEWYSVSVITTDGEEYNESVKAHGLPHAAYQEWEGFGREGVGTIFVHSEDRPGDRATYEQRGNKLARQ